MSWDENEKRVPYLLGGLFAVMEKAQLDALGKDINATIKDRFYGAVSATPQAVFSRLLRLAQHHINKANSKEKKYGVISDRRIGQLMENINEFPAHLDLQEQGLFAIGYYQKRNAIWRKKEGEEKNNERAYQQPLQVCLSV